MKQSLLLLFIFALSGLCFAQQSDGIFAITGKQNSPFNWSDIRSIQSGKNVLLFENGKTPFKMIDAGNGDELKQISVSFHQKNITGRTIVQLTNPTFLMSAAAAYDKKHNKLFFASMHSGHLMWLDMNDHSQSKYYVLQQPILSNDDYGNEALNITRMTIGADGYGYAISNDGNHLLRFSTGRRVSSDDLGMLLDDPSNGALSIHNQCTGWGGDIIADAWGKLYLMTASGNVFKIDIKTKITKFLGAIKNLPPQFSVNGAAVDAGDNVVISSANIQDGLYVLNLNTLEAKKSPSAFNNMNASDLASGWLLGHTRLQVGTAVLPPIEEAGNDMISIFPNPVRNKLLRISFDKILPGNYLVTVTDLQGRLIQNKNVYVKYKGQNEKISFNHQQVSGLYLIKVTDVVSKEIFTGKIFVE